MREVKIENVYEEICRKFLSDRDPLEILNIELNGSVDQKWTAVDYLETKTEGWSKEEIRALAEKILGETSLVWVNVRGMHIFRDYEYNEEGKSIPLGTETHGRCVSAPLGLTGSVSIQDFCRLRGLNLTLLIFNATFGIAVKAGKRVGRFYTKACPH